MKNLFQNEHSRILINLLRNDFIEQLRNQSISSQQPKITQKFKGGLRYISYFYWIVSMSHARGWSKTMTHRYDVINDVFIVQDNEWFAFYALASILAVTVRILKCINSCCTSDCVTPHVSICHMRGRTCHISVTCRFTCYMCVMCVKSVTYNFRWVSPWKF